MLTEGYESRIIDGKGLAQRIETEVRSGVESLKSKRGITPGLATILVGDDPASKMYVRLKHKACERVGIQAEDHFLPAEISQEELISLINTLNSDKNVHEKIRIELPYGLLLSNDSDK